MSYLPQEGHRTLKQMNNKPDQIRGGHRLPDSGRMQVGFNGTRLESGMRAIAGCFSLFFASAAKASGDPAVVWWVGAAFLVHLVALLVILFSAPFKGARFLSAGAFLACTAIVWVLAGYSTGSLPLVGMLVIAVPCGVAYALHAIAITRSERRAPRRH